MYKSENQSLPTAHIRYEQLKENTIDVNTIRWLDRFVYKYALSSSYIGIKVEQRDAFFSKYSAMLGVFFSYQAFQDIANYCDSNGVIEIVPSHHVSSNDLLHRQLINNGTFVRFITRVAEDNEDVQNILLDSLTEKNRNVIVFGYLIAQAINRDDFNSKNIGIRNAETKQAFKGLKAHIEMESNHLFSLAVTALKKSTTAQANSTAFLSMSSLASM